MVLFMLVKHFVRKFAQYLQVFFVYYALLRFIFIFSSELFTIFFLGCVENRANLTVERSFPGFLIFFLYLLLYVFYIICLSKIMHLLKMQDTLSAPHKGQPCWILPRAHACSAPESRSRSHSFHSLPSGRRSCRLPPYLRLPALRSG